MRSIRLPVRGLVGLGVFGLSLALYVATAAPGLTWRNDSADGGELAAAAWTLGVAHPTGYPTYVLLARGFAVLLPWLPAIRSSGVTSRKLSSARITVCSS